MQELYHILFLLSPLSIYSQGHPAPLTLAPLFFAGPKKSGEKRKGLFS